VLQTGSSSNCSDELVYSLAVSCSTRKLRCVRVLALPSVEGWRAALFCTAVHTIERKDSHSEGVFFFPHMGVVHLWGTFYGRL